MSLLGLYIFFVFCLLLLGCLVFFVLVLGLGLCLDGLDWVMCLGLCSGFMFVLFGLLGLCWIEFGFVDSLCFSVGECCLCCGGLIFLRVVFDVVCFSVKWVWC